MKVKVELNKANVRRLLQSQMMMDAVEDVAKKQGEVDSKFIGIDRVQVIVEKGNGDAD